MHALAYANFKFGYREIRIAIKGGNHTGDVGGLRRQASPNQS